MRCKDCKFFDKENGIPEWPGSGHCDRFIEGYYSNVNSIGLKPNDCWVENDEKWGNRVGPEFGCVLFEEKSTSVQDVR